MTFPCRREFAHPRYEIVIADRLLFFLTAPYYSPKKPLAQRSRGGWHGRGQILETLGTNIAASVAMSSGPGRWAIGVKLLAASPEAVPTGSFSIPPSRPQHWRSTSNSLDYKFPASRRRKFWTVQKEGADLLIRRISHLVIGKCTPYDYAAFLDPYADAR